MEADRSFDRHQEESEPKHDLEDADTASSGSAAPLNPKPTRKRRCATHLKRFWWIYLIVLLAILLLVVLLVIFVAFPRIAQRDVNNARLVNVSQTVRNPTPNSVDLTLSAVILSSSRFTPTLDSFNASLYLPGAEDRPFGFLTLPRLHATHVVPVTVNQTLEIVNMDQFILYNTRTLNSETYEVVLSGRTGLKLGGLPKTTVSFTKTITVTGLNGLRGLAVSNVAVSIAPAADGTNMNGTVLIPNPSNISIALGNVTLDLAVDAAPIGTAYVDDLTLRPGDNSVPMRAAANQTAVLGLIAAKHPDGVLPVDITGNRSVYGGETLPYFTAALRSDTIGISLDVAPALERIGINVTELSAPSD